MNEEKNNEKRNKFLIIAICCTVFVATVIWIVVPYYHAQYCNERFDYVTIIYDRWINNELVDVDGETPVYMSPKIIEDLMSEYNDECPNGKPIAFKVFKGFDLLKDDYELVEP